MKLPPGHVAGLGVAKPKCTGGFGERMLRSMGWDTGMGLGKEGNGIKEAIQVKKKEDTVGVGGNGSYAWGDKWWEKAFDSAVQTVGDSDTSDSSDSDSDDEHMAALAAAAAVNRDGTRTSASADELKLLASLSKGGRVAAGRFGGRDAKMARIREQEARMAAEAAAKLGVPSAATAGTTTGGALTSDRSDTTSEVKLSSGGGGSKKRKSSAAAAAAAESGEGGQGQAASSGGKAKKGRKSKQAAAEAAEAGEQQDGEQQAVAAAVQPPKKQRIVIEPVIAQVGPTYDFKPTPATGWWGEKRFASAGCLEGLDQQAAEAARRRMTFNEDDQARIYNAAQANKTQGKVGLGQGTGTVKVGGVKWEGKKVSFEDPEGKEGEGEAQEGGGGGSGRLAAIGSSTHLDQLASASAAQEEGRQQQEEGKRKKKKKQKGAAAEAEEEAAEAAACGSDGDVEGWQAAVKWKKVITRQLQAAEQQQLKLKELQRQVVELVLAKHGPAGASKAGIKAALTTRLQASSKFVVEGKLVRLCS